MKEEKQYIVSISENGNNEEKPVKQKSSDDTNNKNGNHTNGNHTNEFNQFFIKIFASSTFIIGLLYFFGYVHYLKYCSMFGFNISMFNIPFQDILIVQFETTLWIITYIAFIPFIRGLIYLIPCELCKRKMPYFVGYFIPIILTVVFIYLIAHPFNQGGRKAKEIINRPSKECIVFLKNETSELKLNYRIKIGDKVIFEDEYENQILIPEKEIKRIKFIKKNKEI